MKPNIDGYEVIYLRTGEVCFTNKSVVVSTVLGSCVAVTMHSDNPRFASIVHCQLPECKDLGGCNKTCSNPYKYVGCAIPRMFEKFQSMKINPANIVVKVFGGGEIIQSATGVLNGRPRDIRVGAQNVNTAIELLNKYSIKITASDVGGTQGRKLFFYTDSGEVLLNRLKNNG